jgi:hypothetical protein
VGAHIRGEHRSRRREREVEQALVDHIQRFLRELGSSFAFVSRQVHLGFVIHDYCRDLLFCHLKLRCHVLSELKAVPFDPGMRSAWKRRPIGRHSSRLPTLARRMSVPSPSILQHL